MQEPESRRSPTARARLVFPRHARGSKIGLLGGTFDPPHAAHRLISLTALKRLGLDSVWWLVTPGNPLKPHEGLPSLDSRIAAARAVARHPCILVTGLEAALGTHFTVDTLRDLRRRSPSVRFVWLMGADNLATFHKWRAWRTIAALAPIAVIDRAGATFRAMANPAAHALARWRMHESGARQLPRIAPPAWVYLFGVKSPMSSSALRMAKKQRGGS